MVAETRRTNGGGVTTGSDDGGVATEGDVGGSDGGSGSRNGGGGGGGGERMRMKGGKGGRELNRAAWTLSPADGTHKVETPTATPRSRRPSGAPSTGDTATRAILSQQQYERDDLGWPWRLLPS